jgi:hypothetical protein
MFPARYELNSYIVSRKRLVSKRLTRMEENCGSHGVYVVTVPWNLTPCNLTYRDRRLGRTCLSPSSGSPIQTLKPQLCGSPH